VSTRDPIERGLVGPAGEHFVLFKLYRLGMLASLAPPGISTLDILVLSFDQRVVATVQEKTRTFGRDGGWHMSAKHEGERYVSDRHFYAFVDLETDPPTTYVIPSAVVADVLARAHAAWASAPGKGGRQRKAETTFRRIQPAYPDSSLEYPPGWMDEWRERWDLLERATEAVSAISRLATRRKSWSGPQFSPAARQARMVGGWRGVEQPRGGARTVARISIWSPARPHDLPGPGCICTGRAARATEPACPPPGLWSPCPSWPLATSTAAESSRETTCR
jgi:hypothetical protein